MSVFDITAMSAFDHPGADTRQWISYATVDPDTPQVRAVRFTKEYGPLVNCTLRPSAIPVVCRVAGSVAGIGEAEWNPFISGDEVIVGIPEGDESAGCIILGRCNQELDVWPSMVASQDTTQNSIAFRRSLAPYIFEFGQSALFRQATNGAFLVIRSDGSITLSDSEKAYFTLSASLIGFQDSTGNVAVQIDVEGQSGSPQIVLSNGATKFIIDATNSSLYTGGTMQLGTAGNQAGWHATSIESIAVLIANAVVSMGLLVLPGPSVITPLTAVAGVNKALGLSSNPATGSAGPYAVAIKAALQTAPNFPLNFPNVATPGFFIG